MIASGVGISSKTENPMEAGSEAAAEASKNLGKPDLFIVLSSIAMHHPEVLSGIRKDYPDTPLIGCSTSGEITGLGSHKKSVVVMALKSDQMHFTIAKGAPVKDNPREAGKILAENIKKAAPEEVTSMIMFSDVLGANGTEITRGVLDVFGANFLMVGGAAGDDLNFTDTHEYFNGEVLSGYTVGVGLSGKYTKAFGAKHGWEKVGSPKQVTKSKGTVVFEIDGKSAFDFYKDYLGERADQLKEGTLTQIGLTYPLGMVNPNEEGVIIRTPLAVNPDNSIAFGAEVKEGSTVSIMMGTQEKAMQAAEDVAKNVKAEFAGGAPKAIFISDCVARLKLYGPKASEEIKKVTDVMGDDVPLIGFYSYGQHAPVAGVIANIDACDPGFYEESIVIFAIGE